MQILSAISFWQKNKMENFINKKYLKEQKLHVTLGSTESSKSEIWKIFPTGGHY